VHITQEMLLLQPNMVSTIGADMNSADAFQLNPTALMAIQGWMDAVSNLPRYTCHQRLCSLEIGTNRNVCSLVNMVTP
jgi:hypothetical protein